MSITYRTSGAWGPGIGTDLTPTQVDENFWELYQDFLSKATQGVGISNFQVSGNQMTVVLTDHTILGPYTLPTTSISFRGTWGPGIDYFTNDIFTYGGNTYIVLENHTSNPTFNANATDGHGNNYYGLLLENPGNQIQTGGLTGQVLVKASNADFATRWIYNTLEGLADVIGSPAPTTGDVPTWNGSAFVFQPAGTGALVDLADVAIATPTDGQVLEYVASTQRWENVSLATMATQNASDVAITGGTIADVTITGLPAPVNATDPATRAYVDGAASGFPAITGGDLIANIGTSPAPPAGVSLTQYLDTILPTTLLGALNWGNIIFRGHAEYEALSPGTAGFYLSSGGPGADPAWVPLTVYLSALADTAITIPATDDQLIYNGTTWNNQRPKYVVACYAPALLTGGQVLLYHRFSKAVTLPGNLGSYLGHQTVGGASVPATLATTITLAQALNATPTSFTNIGTVVYGAASAKNTALTTAGGAPVNFAQGDILRITGPTPADSTLSDVHLTLVGYES